MIESLIGNTSGDQYSMLDSLRCQWTSHQEFATVLFQALGLNVTTVVLRGLCAAIATLIAPFLFRQAYTESIMLGQNLSLLHALAILLCPIGIIAYNFGVVRTYRWINFIRLPAVLAINFLFLLEMGPTASACALIANEIISMLIVGESIFRRRKLSRI